MLTVDDHERHARCNVCETSGEPPVQSPPDPAGVVLGSGDDGVSGVRSYPLPESRVPDRDGAVKRAGDELLSFVGIELQGYHLRRVSDERVDLSTCAESFPRRPLVFDALLEGVQTLLQQTLDIFSDQRLAFLQLPRNE
ncbi:unnamed protein product [Leptidea sinapis]|uniref:Uncharacterized protein n=1 Tax=Leptidea sinapis TaxID=189913 RepID=A0A5E4QCD6_9NEOP|nr:unnamed protein product [Leptidea sinapis]